MKNRYLILIGIRSCEFGYDDNTLFDNTEYFERCRVAELSAYKALLFLGDYLKGDYKI